jgi:glycosyltransferase involved in cell wall biosynthesis
MISRGIAILTYNRSNNIDELIEKVQETKPNNCKVVVCDDGSNDDTPRIVSKRKDVSYVRGPNLGVAANKNRALFALQDCHFIAMLEDDLFPNETGWFELYESAVCVMETHHFCRIQADDNKKIREECVEGFTEWIKQYGLTPLYTKSPRGDFTFLTSKVVKTVGAFNPQFVGAGYAHGEWSDRVHRAGLISHPLRWVDFEETSKKFYQKGDTDGGRWLENQKEIQSQLKANAKLRRQLRKSDYIFHPITLT